MPGSGTGPALGARRVVVTGVGVLSGSAVGVDAFWDRLVAPPDEVAVRLEGFEPRRWLDRRQVQRADRSAQVAVAAARLAQDDAGAPALDPDRTAVVMASWMSGRGAVEESVTAYARGGLDAVPVQSTALIMTSAGAAHIALALGARGPSFTVGAACASGGQAIADGARLLRWGLADVVFVGGSDAHLGDDQPDQNWVTAGFLTMRVHSREQRARPFDVDRGGFVLAEGAAVLRLEDLDAARARGARCYAEVAGGATTTDAHDLVAPHPEGEGLERAMRLALAEAGVEPAAVRHVNAHGSATGAGDVVEAGAIRRVFGAPGPAVTSTKGTHGHTGAAAGAVEGAALALAIERGVLPPTNGCEHLDERLGLDVVHGSPRAWEPGPALGNSMGLGGANASVVLLPVP
jgi:3-oxoacyl-[acyl-carrier-protein] synthase II